MRKILSALLIPTLLAALCACGAQADAGQTELVVFAAASLKETLTEIGENYKAVAPNVTIRFNFDSSGTLKTQIAEGADCDLFLSAAPRQMNQLDGALRGDAEKNPDGLDLVLQGTRCDLLENRIVLVVPEGNPKGIASFDELAARLAAGDVLLAMGNGDVPAGQYAQRILAFYGLDEAALAAKGALTYGGNVKEVVTQVAEAAADCGVVYATDAFSAKLPVADEAAAELCGRVVYPAAVLNTTKHEAEAKAFLAYLKGAEAAAVFESVGFTPLG